VGDGGLGVLFSILAFGALVPFLGLEGSGFGVLYGLLVGGGSGFLGTC
jgi:hypothetical protein